MSPKLHLCKSQSREDIYGYIGDTSANHNQLSGSGGGGGDACGEEGEQNIELPRPSEICFEVWK